ncbi:MAG: hypothetical protein HYU39_03190 [Thaumarchaeota archaeon]|nr:hypothetical protein [Nitrososphaerota archaeon]
MSIVTILTFDLTGATPEQHNRIREKLEARGMFRKVRGLKGDIELPSNTYVMETATKPDPREVASWLSHAAIEAGMRYWGNNRYCVFIIDGEVSTFPFG